MEITLSPLEARIIGCLLEKEVTTPDQYPLTLNSLTTACNQKSNRDPVMSLDEATVMDTLESLKSKRLIQEVTGFGSRVTKYQHRFCNTEFSTLQFSEQEKGILCVLLLRGPQTAGEIRTRTNRLCTFADVKEAETLLASMAEDSKGPFVVKLPRESGKRDSRYMHLFGDEDIAQMSSTQSQSQLSVSGGHDEETEERLALLEDEVASLKEEILMLKDKIRELSE
ncbi:YceH family protein [Photobacterium sp. 53610]|uniref:YceH family protein n=1 Tax=Photobacterium sp. 53610 TaxID=3102789 RepID=UPI002EDA30E3